MAMATALPHNHIDSIGTETTIFVLSNLISSNSGFLCLSQLSFQVSTKSMFWSGFWFAQNWSRERERENDFMATKQYMVWFEWGKIDTKSKSKSFFLSLFFSICIIAVVAVAHYTLANAWTLDSGMLLKCDLCHHYWLLQFRQYHCTR